MVAGFYLHNYFIFPIILYTLICTIKIKIKAAMIVCFASTGWMGTGNLKTLDIRDEDNGIKLLYMHSNFEKSVFSKSTRVKIVCIPNYTKIHVYVYQNTHKHLHSIFINNGSYWEERKLHILAELINQLGYSHRTRHRTEIE